MGAFKRLILWIEGTEDEIDLDTNWSTAYMGAFKTYTMDWRYWGWQWLGYKLINCLYGSF